MPKPIGKNKENFERTRSHLIAVATKCFAQYGYINSSTNMIIQQAKSSRGSLYNHFPHKSDLFKAVYDTLWEEMSKTLSQYPYKEKCLIQDLIDGCCAYMSQFTKQTFAQIILIDAPHILGIDYCRSRDSETAYKALHEGILEITKKKDQALLIADYLSGALDTFALRIATSQNRKTAYKKYATAFEEFTHKILEGYR